MVLPPQSVSQTRPPPADLRGWRIALLHNARPLKAGEGLPDDFYEEYDSDETIGSIRDALRELVAEVVLVEADRSLPAKLAAGGFRFAFNLAEGTGRRCREAIPAAVCELLGLPFSGSDLLTLGLTLDKAMARRVVGSEVRLPRAVLVQREADFHGLGGLSYPVIVKPNDEGSSKGIRDNPIADDAYAARRRCEWLREQYGCPAIVEEFVGGVEVTVGILGNTPCERILGIMEIEPAEADARFVYSLEVKRDWRRRVVYHVPPRLSGEAVAEIGDAAIKAFRLLGCRDFARMDLRLDCSGRLYFLECNALPGLNSANSDMVLLSRNTLTHRQLVQEIFLEAVRRCAAAGP
jgi:D-alanine-D-alanine ligase